MNISVSGLEKVTWSRPLNRLCFHRHQIIEIDNVLLWLAMEFEKQTALINEYEQERAIQRRRQEDEMDGETGQS